MTRLRKEYPEFLQMLWEIWSMCNFFSGSIGVDPGECPTDCRVLIRDKESTQVVFFLFDRIPGFPDKYTPEKLKEVMNEYLVDEKECSPFYLPIEISIREVYLERKHLLLECSVAIEYFAP